MNTYKVRSEEDMARYTICNGSKSGHCCFVVTVVDTKKPEIFGGEHYQDTDGQLQYETVCECFTAEDADLVCKALNAIDAENDHRR